MKNLNRNMKQLHIIFFTLIVAPIFGQDYWKETRNPEVFRSEKEVIIEASEYTLYKLDVNKIREELLQAPDENSVYRTEKSIFLPMPDGVLEEYRVEESSIMEPALQAKFPNIRTYRGYNSEGKVLRLDINDNNFHAAIMHNGKMTYIDPYFEDNTVYAAYVDESLANYGGINCGTLHKEIEQRNEGFSYRKGSGSEIEFRKFRYAVSCTGEFGKRAGSKEAALAEITTHTNRINLIFEQELSTQLVLVDGLEKVMFLDPETDRYADTKSGKAMIDLNTAVMKDSIGIDNFDIGHLYNTSCDVGGIAYVGSLCNDPLKAGALTCAANQNVNYFVLVTAHELGHQFSALHTMNNCQGKNESTGSAFEVGSGSTIMSYAGLCGANNVQSGSDSYYHSHSLKQLYTHSRIESKAGKCAEKTSINNFEPEIETMTDGKYIPTQTPFVLTGTGKDKNEEDVLSYTWEQMNLGPSSPLGKPEGNAPRFRSFTPTPSGERIIPAPRNILINFQPLTEKLSTESQDLRFNFVVRDNHVGGGTATWDATIIKTLKYGEEGKYQIESFNSSKSLKPGELVNLEWTVGNTLDTRIGADYMDLYLFEGSSSDFSFDNMTLLAEGITNNGAYSFNMPAKVIKKGRFVLRGHDNIFFDVNNQNFRVPEPTEPTLATQASPNFARICASETTSLSVDLKTTGFAGASGNVSFKTKSQLPSGISLSGLDKKVAIGENNVLTFSFGNVKSGVYPIEIEATTEGGQSFTQVINLDVTKGDNEVVTPIFPEDKATSVPLDSKFTWNKIDGASSYYIQFSEKENFTEYTELVGVESEFKPKKNLKKNTTYYWRIKGNNNCDAGNYSPTYSFTSGFPTSTNEEILGDVKIYPNPTSDKVTISNNRDFTRGNITDISGRKLMSFEIKGSTKTLDLSSYATGMYFLNLEGAEAKATQKIVLNK